MKQVELYARVRYGVQVEGLSERAAGVTGVMIANAGVDRVLTAAERHHIVEVRDDVVGIAEPQGLSAAFLRATK
jgi:hypothetical protein